MGLLRRRGRPATESDAMQVGDDLYVVSKKAADLAVAAQKERRRASLAERRLAETQEATLLGDKKTLKAAKKRWKSEDDAADDEPTGAADPVTGAKVKRYIGIARIVVPVVAPIIYQGVGMARERWDAHRARQLGVAPDELGDFTGRGAALYARVHHIALSAQDLRTRHGSGDDPRAAEVRAFVEDAEQRLSDLESAVRAAEQMPASRRRSAHVAVAGELERIEDRLLALWGVGGSNPRTAVTGPR